MDTSMRHARIRDSLAAGRAVVLLAGDTGGLMMAADRVSAGCMAFAVRHGSGLVRVALSDERAARLHLPVMWRDHGDDRPAAAYTVSVDAAEGITTGISARDRTMTVRLLADPATQPDQLSRPGHVMPVRARTGGATFADVCLTTLAEFGHDPVAVFTDVVDGPLGEIAGPPALRAFAAAHDLPLVVRGRRSARLTAVRGVAPDAARPIAV